MPGNIMFVEKCGYQFFSFGIFIGFFATNNMNRKSFLLQPDKIWDNLRLTQIIGHAIIRNIEYSCVHKTLFCSGICYYKALQKYHQPETIINMMLIFMQKQMNKSFDLGIIEDADRFYRFFAQIIVN